jgi:hypothetical protein
VGGCVSLATVDLRDRLGIVIGALAGVLAGAIAEQLITQRANRDRASTDLVRREGASS